MMLASSRHRPTIRPSSPTRTRRVTSTQPAHSPTLRQQQLAYYEIRAPFAGVVGDIPVHLGDYVSPTTLLTTVDENADLEAYIYVPTERATQIRTGLPVDILDTAGEVLIKSNDQLPLAPGGQWLAEHPGQS